MANVEESAKKTAMALSFAVDMSLAKHMPCGAESRVHDFVYGDIPVLLHHTGVPIENMTAHQRTLLDMPATDFRRQAEENFEAAADVMRWTAPQNDFDVKEFMGHGSFSRSTVFNLLDHYEQVHDDFISPSQNIRNNAVIVNDVRNPLSEEYFEEQSKKLRESGDLLSGMDVTLRNDPQGNIVRTIEATVLESHGPGIHTTKHAVSGLTRLIGEQELNDNRGVETMMGVIIQDKGKHYIVQTDDLPANPYMFSNPVREVVGISGTSLRDNCKNLNAALSLDSNNEHKLPATSSNFTIRNLRGVDDSRGPCTIIHSGKQLVPDRRELGMAYHYLEAHKARYNSEPDNVIRLITREEDNRQDQQASMSNQSFTAILSGHQGR